MYIYIYIFVSSFVASGIQNLVSYMQIFQFFKKTFPSLKLSNGKLKLHLVIFIFTFKL